MLTENHLEMGNVKAKIVIHIQSLLLSEFKKNNEADNVFSGCTLLFLIMYVVKREETPGSGPQVYWRYGSDPLTSLSFP